MAVEGVHAQLAAVMRVDHEQVGARLLDRVHDLVIEQDLADVFPQRDRAAVLHR